MSKKSVAILANDHHSALRAVEDNRDFIGEPDDVRLTMITPNGFADAQRLRPQRVLIAFHGERTPIKNRLIKDAASAVHRVFGGEILDVSDWKASE